MPQTAYSNDDLNLLNGSLGITHPIESPAIDLELANGTIVRYSTRDLTISGVNYLNYLHSIGPLRQSQTAAADRCEVRLYNADGALGPSFIGTDLLDNAFATIYRVYKNPVTGDSFRRERFHGIVVTPKSDDEFITLTVLSDTFAKRSLMGDTAVDKKCTKLYKGTEPGGCGYVGDLPSCDFTLDGANGCRVHFSDEEAKIRYGGHALLLDPVTIASLPVPPVVIVVGGGGGDYGGGGYGGGYGDYGYGSDRYGYNSSGFYGELGY